MGHIATPCHGVVIIRSHRHSVLDIRQTGGGFMKKLTLTLAAVALALGSMAMTASAQTQAPGVASLHAQLQNATPIVKQVACNGTTGIYGCGPGWVRRCGYYGCRCVPCY
jgi:hypothetical protein